MKIEPASYKILDRRNRNSFQKIEQAGRLAYKSEDKIDDNSAEPFVNKMAKATHFPVIEFANVHVLIQVDRSIITDFRLNKDLQVLVAFLFPCKYLHLSAQGNSVVLSGTVRAFMDTLYNVPIDKNTLPHLIASTLSMGYKDKFPFKIDVGDCSIHGYTCSVVDPETVRNVLSLEQMEDHLMCAVKFIVNRAVTHELVRHRPCSWLQESQRYCRYSEDKFGNEVTFISPKAFYKIPEKIDPPYSEDIVDCSEFLEWMWAMEECEKTYFKLLKTSTPQAARTVLPNSCKTEIICFCSITEWRHIFNLRTSPAAEPSMREVMIPLAGEFFSPENQKLWE